MVYSIHSENRTLIIILFLLLSHSSWDHTICFQVKPLQNVLDTTTLKQIFVEL